MDGWGSPEKKIGTYNPLLPKDRAAERLTLDQERAKHWMKAGAQPTDRVARMLDKAGINAVTMTPSEFDGFFRSEAARWTKTYREIGIKLDE